MKTTILFLTLCFFSSCTFLQKVGKSCRTQLDQEPGGRVLFCAVCDSTAKDIFKPIAKP